MLSICFLPISCLLHLICLQTSRLEEANTSCQSICQGQFCIQNVFSPALNFTKRVASFCFNFPKALPLSFCTWQSWINNNTRCLCSLSLVALSCKITFFLFICFKTDVYSWSSDTTNYIINEKLRYIISKNKLPFSDNSNIFMYSTYFSWTESEMCIAWKSSSVPSQQYFFGILHEL